VTVLIWAGSLPTASFRFHLAMDTLAVRIEVPVIKAYTGTFTRQVTSWLAFAPHLPSVRSRSRVMPDAPYKNGHRQNLWPLGIRFYV
jgi:hypothetical protein